MSNAERPMPNAQQCPVLKQVVTCNSSMAEGIDGVDGNGDEMVRIGGVYEAVLVGGSGTGVLPVS